MEQTVNTFSEGLLMDVHPMMQGSNSLSNALNATFITQNGNEISLLNDMGNRKVDNAYLLPGYEPVGIKEHGGIIYVASYNPITNRSLIGSFPSPELRINENDKSELRTEISNLDDYFTSSAVNEGNIKFLTKDSVIQQITGNQSLHVGDKFTIYSNDLYKDDVINNVTNYNNIKNNKIDSPKNKKYTLSAGVLNSQNEFVDITNSLERWNGDNEIILKKSSDLYHFNEGYFIAKNDTSDWSNQTIDDQNLLRERAKIAVNTYAYKLVGPLALKIKLNHILDVSYSVRAAKTKKGNVEGVTLVFTILLTYNCPDGITTISSGDDTYYSYYEGKCEDDSIDLYVYNSAALSVESTAIGPYLNPSQGVPSGRSKVAPKYEGYVGRVSDIDVNYTEMHARFPELWKLANNSDSIECLNPIFSNTVYDPNTNLYTRKIIKEYFVTFPTSGRLNYYLCTKSGLSEHYLKSLSYRSWIDLDLVGTNTLQLSGWTFYTKINDDKPTVTLKITFNTYKVADLITYENIKLTFECDDGRNDTSIYLDDENTNETIITDFKYRHVYKLKSMSYDIYKTENELKEKIDSVEVDYSNNNLFIITTTLFNNSETQGSNIIANYLSMSETDKTKFNEKLKINITLTKPEIKIIKSDNYNDSGKFIADTINENITYERTYTHQISANSKLGIENELLYPEILTQMINEYKESVKINYIYELKSDSINSELNGSTITCSDKFSTIANKALLSEKFVSLKDIFWSKYINTTNRLATIGLGYEKKNSGKNWHYFVINYNVINNNDSEKIIVIGEYFEEKTSPETRILNNKGYSYNCKWEKYVRRNGSCDITNSINKPTIYSDLDSKTEGSDYLYMFAYDEAQLHYYKNSKKDVDKRGDNNTHLLIKLYNEQGQFSRFGILNDLITYNEATKENNDLYDKIFGRKYYYVEDKTIKNTIGYVPNVNNINVSNYITKYKYNIKVLSEINNLDEINITDSSNLIGFKINSITSEGENNNLITSESESIDVESNDDSFENYIISNISFSDIVFKDDNDIFTKDSDGNSLDINKVYYKIGGKLKKSTNLRCKQLTDDNKRKVIIIDGSNIDSNIKNPYELRITPSGAGHTIYKLKEFGPNINKISN